MILQGTEIETEVEISNASGLIDCKNTKYYQVMLV